MRFASFRLVVCILAVVAFLAVPARAQYTPGSITGTVVDPTGAVVPGATVELVDPATGYVRTQETGDAGQFSFDRVAARVYTLRVGKQGFRTTELKSVEVTTGKITSLGQVRLEVGAAGETVTVEAAAVPLVQAETAQITGNYSTRQVSEVIFGIMGADATAFLTPGVQPGVGTGFSNSNTGAGSTGIGGLTGLNSDISVNGMRGRSNNFTYDGQSVNDVTVAGPGLFVANLDTVQEYQITTNQFNADQGRNMGATINLISKSGTNDVHGTAFWFHENSAVAARSSGESQAGAEKPSFFLDNFGGFTLGGPVIKNKLFAFGSFYVERQPGSALARTGLLALTDAGVATVRAAFPASTTMLIYQNGGPLQRPTGNPVCRPDLGPPVLLGVTPGTSPFAGVSGVEACAIQRTVESSFNNEEWTSRIDWNGKKNSFWGRYYFSDNAFCCSEGSDGYGVAVPARSQALSLTHTIQLSPRQLNEFRFNFTRLFVTFEGADTFPISALGSNLTNITMPSGFRSFGLATNLPQGRGVTDFQFQDNWSVTRGRHTIKAGIDIRRDREVNFFLPNVNGAFAFPSTTRFVNNQPSSFSFGAGDFTIYTFETDWYYYVQDDIRLNNFLGGDLALNLGLRYENGGQPLNNLFDETLARESDPARAFWLQSVPVEERIYPKTERDDNNWAPRIGFAYSPKWGKAIFGENKTVIRGGYGIAYEIAFTNMLLNSATAVPRVFLFSNSCPTGSACGIIGIPGSGSGSEVAVVANPPFNTVDPRRPPNAWTLAGDLVNRNLLRFDNPYSQNWSLGIQRELGRSSIFEVRYVGTQGVGLFQTVSANPNARLYSLGSAVLGGTSAIPGYFDDGVNPTATLGACPAGTQRVADFGSRTARCVVTPGQSLPSGTGFCTDATQPGFGGLICGLPTDRVRDRVNTARSLYHSLQTRLETRNFKDQFTGGLSWTWAHNIDNVSEVFADVGSISSSQDPFDWHRKEKGNSNIDQRHSVAFNAIWDTPWLRDQKGALGKFLGGWELSAYGLIYSPRFWTPDQANGGFGGRSSEGNQLGGRNIFCSMNLHSSIATNTCAPFASNISAPLSSVGVFYMTNGVPLLYDYNTCDPNTIAFGGCAPITPNDVHWIANNLEAQLAGLPTFGVNRNLPSTQQDNVRAINLGIFKNTYVGKENRVNIQFRMILVNAFSHRNYGIPDDFVEDGFPSFGDPGQNNVIGRKIRFGLRVVF